MTTPKRWKGPRASVNQALMMEIDIHYSLVQPKLGGYAHIFGYWAPGKTIMLQEDALGMCSPSIYRDIFMQFNAEIVKHLGPHVLFHFHSTGYKHYTHVHEYSRHRRRGNHAGNHWANLARLGAGAQEDFGENSPYSASKHGL